MGLISVLYNRNKVVFRLSHTFVILCVANDFVGDYSEFIIIIFNVFFYVLHSIYSSYTIT